jgi:hypothetical protein
MLVEEARKQAFSYYGGKEVSFFCENTPFTGGL